MTTFFISYLREDQKVAEQIANELRRSGYKMFFDKEAIKVGDDWRLKISTAIQSDCDYFLILWSTNGKNVSESFVPVELNLAREKHVMRFQQGDAFIIPVLIGPDAKFPASFRLEDIQVLRLQEKNSAAVEQLVNKISEKVNLLVKGFPIDFSSATGTVANSLEKIRKQYPAVITRLSHNVTTRSTPFDEFDYIHAIGERIDHLGDSVKITLAKNSEQVNSAIKYFKEWMINETVVRVIGAGRAKLAATIPANRLAHGGARVYLQDGTVPMPHDIKCGGTIAVSASGQTPSVLEVLRKIYPTEHSKNLKSSPFKVIGIANHDAAEFAGLCDVFIGIHLSELPNPLRALADTEEFVISLLLDAIVVSAGWQAGFDDTRWRLGHENLGATGPYDTATIISPLPQAPHSLIPSHSKGRS